VASGKALEYHPAGWPTPQEAPAGKRKPLSGPTSRSESPGPEPRNSPAGDALVTSGPGILLSVRTADCLPVLVADVKLRVVAAVHAGWRGALARVIEKTVGEMRRMFGSAPDNLVAALGPGIGRCCYEVGDEVVDAFRDQFTECDDFFCQPLREPEADYSSSRYSLLFHTQAPPGHCRERSTLHLDLAAVAQAQLTAGGVKASAIHHSGYCTACRGDLFFSYRREGAHAGRMMAVIGIRQ
jgi:polyphenol oxidase